MSNRLLNQIKSMKKFIKGVRLCAYSSKISLKMKLTTLLLVVSLFQMHANDTYGQDIKISLDMKQVNLKSVLTKIEQKTDFKFLYEKNIFQTNKIVNISAKKEKLSSILDKLFKDANVSIVFLKKQIVIKAKLDRVITPKKEVKQIEFDNQQFVVSGVVSDTNGQPLPGANILEKGTTNGTQTDFDGKFSIELANEQVVLVVSYLGFLTKEVVVNNQETIAITLVENAASLEEIVLVGYGSVKKGDLTGSVSSLSSKVFDTQPTTKPSEILQGRVAGVSVSTPSGKPGGNQVIRIRGANSIIGNNAPLVVVDDLIGADFNTLNPNNIESIQVLKDASATAIYGSRGANGVILVTTKKGKKGKAQITFDYFTTLSSVPKKVKILDAVGYTTSANNRRRYAKYSQQINDLTDFNYPTEEQILTPDINGNRSMTWLYYHPEAIAAARTGELAIDWQDEIFRNANTNNYNLSVRGGNDNVSYSISGNYLDQEGLVINSNYKRFNFRGSINAQASDRLKVGATVLLSRENDNPVGEGSRGNLGVVSAALYALPVGLGVKYPETFNDSRYPFSESLVGRYFNHRGSYGGFGDSSPNGGGLINPVAAALEPEREVITSSNTLSAYLDYELAKGLKLKITGGTVSTNSNNRNYFNELINGRSTSDGQRTANIRNKENFFWQNSNILTYSKIFDKHSFAVTGLFEQQYATSTESYIAVQGFNNNTTSFNAIQSAEIVTEKSSLKEKRVILSYMGRINYGFDDRFLLTASLRSDGSSVFGANNKWGIFPSGAFAWKLSNEKFLENSSHINNLKLRLSYGVTGNQAINPYQTLSQITTGGTSLDYPTNGGSLSLGSAFNRIANPDLKWEKTAQSNFGVDLSLFNYKLNFTADYYYKKTSDLLSSRTLASQSGFSSVLQNVGEVENKGFEFILDGTLIEQNGFRWTAGLNMTFNKNKVVELSTPDEERILLSDDNGAPDNDVMYLLKGQPLGAIYGYQYAGVWQLGEETEAFGYGQIPGTAKIIDQNNDGVYDEKDKVFLGSANPDFTWGFNTAVNYKGFDLNVQFQGSQGGEIYNRGARNRFDMEDVGATGYRGRERWHPINHLDGYYQRVDYTGTINQTAARQNAANIFTRKDAWQSDIFVEDASYVRLSNVTLAYNFNEKLISKLGVDAMRLYLSGQNLALWTDYTGYDPELAANENDGVRGYELNGYPKARTFTLGVKVDF